MNNIESALIRLRWAVMLDGIKESTEGKRFKELATSHGKGQGRPDYFALTQKQYHGGPNY